MISPKCTFGDFWNIVISNCQMKLWYAFRIPQSYFPPGRKPYGPEAEFEIPSYVFFPTSEFRIPQS